MNGRDDCVLALLKGEADVNAKDVMTQKREKARKWREGMSECDFFESLYNLCFKIGRCIHH